MSKKYERKKKGKKESFNVLPGGIMTIDKRVLKHICSFTDVQDEVMVKVIGDEGIFILAVDPAHVMMRDLHIKPSPLVVLERDVKFGIDLSKLLVSTGQAKSRSEANRLIAQGAISIDGEKVTGNIIEVKSGCIVRAGKRRFARVIDIDITG